MTNAKRFFFIGFPLLALSVPALWYAGAGSDEWLKGEKGIVENLTVLFLSVSIGFSISGLRNAFRLALSNLVKVWMVMLILGALYFALEEISYGQHMFGWAAGETWQNINDQNETNLHNTHAAFDQLPRTLLMAGVLIGGVIMPVWRIARKTTLNESSRLYWLWPTSDCITAGLLVVLIRQILDVPNITFVDAGEMKEYLFGLFILIYCVSLRTRLAQRLRSPREADRPADV